ncbi:MAG: glycosyltransferase family 39 protein [Chloroflexi bacterium]|nr:glycosyltransferase family 39 protein [Chloroflexota bacterium]
MSQRTERTARTIILLLAALLRFWNLGDVPPGLAHDEVANWLIARDILSGQHAIYFTAAYGHEPLYQYIQAGSVAVLGDHWLGIRYPSAALGLLGLAVTYVLVRRLFSVSTALLSATWLAISFWSVFYSRVGLRAISLTVTAALFAYYLFRALEPRSTQERGVACWLWAGLYLGLSAYTYMAARILPIIVIVLLGYLLLFHAPARRCWWRMIAMLGVAASVGAPLVVWLLANPGAEHRISEIQEPMIRLLSGDPGPVWNNLIANLKMFTIAGDPWPRQNVPGRPIFADPLSAALFYIGLVVALRYWRQPRYGFLVIWLLGSLGPSVATTDPPSSIRGVLGLVTVFTLPSLAITEMGKAISQRLAVGERRRGARAATGILIVVSLAVTGAAAADDYFVRWPQNEVVRFDHQADLAAVGQALNELPSDVAVTVGGLSPLTMDGPSLTLSTRRDTSNVRLCDPRETLVIPTGSNVRIFLPGIVPFDPDLRDQINQWGGDAVYPASGAFVQYTLQYSNGPSDIQRSLDTNARLPSGRSISAPVPFGRELVFLGHRRSSAESGSEHALTILTYWHVDRRPSHPVKIFVHLLTTDGDAVIQDDGLSSPPTTWSPGDLIIQKHTLSIPEDWPLSTSILQTGVYDVGTGVRLMVLGADRLLLSPIEVLE